MRPPSDAAKNHLLELERDQLEGGLTLLVASTRRARLRGLAQLDALAPGHALLLEPCRSVHTAGMHFALDLLWLDAAGELVRLDRGVAPWRLRGCRLARAVVECNAGDGERFAAPLAAAARNGGRARADVGVARSPRVTGPPRG